MGGWTRPKGREMNGREQETMRLLSSLVFFGESKKRACGAGIARGHGAVTESLTLIFIDFIVLSDCEFPISFFIYFYFYF